MWILQSGQTGEYVGIDPSGKLTYFVNSEDALGFATSKFAESFVDLITEHIDPDVCYMFLRPKLYQEG